MTVASTIEQKAAGQQRPMLKHEWLERYLAALRCMGIHPQVVIRDGTVVYDEGLPADWVQARCLFHLLQDITADLLKAVNAYRKTLPDPPKQPKGRPRGDAPPSGTRCENGDLASSVSVGDPPRDAAGAAMYMLA